MSNIIGKKLGQLHDDIDEVEGGKIIMGSFLAPKLYGVTDIGYSKEDTSMETLNELFKHEVPKIIQDFCRKVVVASHIQAKGIPRKVEMT